MAAERAPVPIESRRQDRRSIPTTATRHSKCGVCTDNRRMDGRPDGRTNERRRPLKTSFNTPRTLRQNLGVTLSKKVCSLFARPKNACTSLESGRQEAAKNWKAADISNAFLIREARRSQSRLPEYARFVLRRPGASGLTEFDQKCK